MIEIVTGDLLESKEKYIIHNVNCVSNKKAAGLAKDIFTKYPYADCYLNRSDASEPGTIDIKGDGISNRHVINLHAQFYPGRPKYPDSIKDGILVREKYFHQCLLKVARIPNLESIALAWGIGAGLAGGIWSHVLGTITNFANYIEEKQGAKVVIYRLPTAE